jgi:adenylyltransferase/sulfurtransferase
MVLSKKELIRYSRQTVLSEIGLKGQERLKKAKVCIVGVGGLGPFLNPTSSYGNWATSG